MGLVVVLVVLVVVLGFAVYYLPRVARQRTSKFTFEEFQFDHGVATPNLMTSQPSRYVSLIMPAFNEELRISSTLDDTITYMDGRCKQTNNNINKTPLLSSTPMSQPPFSYEIIVVDDGSADKTADVVRDYIQRHSDDKIRLLRLPRNRGKGFAVKQGMLRARGHFLLMVDADGATELHTGFESLERSLVPIITPNSHRGIAVGSRAHLVDDAVAKRNWLRNFLMFGFHFLVSFVSNIRNVKDTQCGFKLFTRQSAKECFFNQHIDRWCFDIELLSIAQRFHTPIVEVPVNWREIPGSKLNVTTASITMLRDLLLIRLFYMTNLWKITRV